LENIIFGKYIRDLRLKLKLPLRIVSAKLDIDQSSLSKIERGEMNAPEHTVKIMSKLFNIDFKELQVLYLSQKIYNQFKNSDYALESIKKSLSYFNNESSKNSIQDSKEVKLIRKYFKSKPIEKAWLFGSYARGDFDRSSDIDILIRFTDKNKIDLLDYIGYTQELEKLLDLEVDLVEEGKLLSDIEKNTRKDQILIYEK